MYVFWKFYAEDMAVDIFQNQMEMIATDTWESEVIYNPGTTDFDLVRKRVVLRDYSLYVIQDGDTTAALIFPLITLSWKSTSALLLEKSLPLKRVKIENPKIRYSNLATIKEKEQVNNLNLSIESIELLEAEVVYEDVQSSEKLSAVASFTISDFAFDSSLPFHFANDILRKAKGSITQIESALSDGFHQIRLEELIFDGKQGALHTRGLVFEPKYDRKTFARKRGVQTDHIVFTADSLSISKTNFADNDTLKAESITIFSSKLLAYRDKNYEIPNDRFVAILVDKLMEWDIPIYIEQVILKDGRIEYDELGQGMETPGKVKFTHLDGRISMLTNLPDLIDAEDKQLILEAQARLYGKAVLSVQLSYDLLSKNGNFLARGRLGSMDLQELNSILTPLANLKIARGTSEVVYFTFGGTRNQSNGELIFRYNDVKLEWDDNSKKVQLFLKNTLTNLILSSSNPNRRGQHRIGAISFERDTRRSMFNYWWKSLQTGFMSVLGEREAKEIVEE